MCTISLPHQMRENVSLIWIRVNKANKSLQMHPNLLRNSLFFQIFVSFFAIDAFRRSSTRNRLNGCLSEYLDCCCFENSSMNVDSLNPFVIWLLGSWTTVIILISTKTTFVCFFCLSLCNARIMVQRFKPSHEMNHQEKRSKMWKSYVYDWNDKLH